LVWKGVKRIGCALNAESTILVCRYWSGDRLDPRLTANMPNGFVFEVGHREKTYAVCQSTLATQATQPATPSSTISSAGEESSTATQPATPSSTISSAGEATATPIDQFPVPDSPAAPDPTKAEANAPASPDSVFPDHEPVPEISASFPVPDSPKLTEIKPPSLEGMVSAAARGVSVTNRPSQAASYAQKAADEAIAHHLSQEDVVTAAADAALSEAESEGLPRDVVLREVGLAACCAGLKARLHQIKSQLAMPSLAENASEPPDATEIAAKASALKHVEELTGDRQEAQTVVDQIWEQLQHPVVAVATDPVINEEPTASLDGLEGNDVAGSHYAEDAASSGPPSKQKSTKEAAQPASAERKVQEAGETAAKVAIQQGLGICDVFRSARDAAEANARDQGFSDSVAQKLATEEGVKAVTGASTHDVTVVKENLKACVDIVGEEKSSQAALKIDLIFETNAHEQDAHENKAGNQLDEPADDPSAELKKTRTEANNACKQAGRKEAALATKRGESTGEVAASVAVACARAAQVAGAQEEQALKLASLVAARVIGNTTSDGDKKKALMRATVKASLGMSILPSDMIEAIAEAAGKAQYEKSVKDGVPYEEALKLASDAAADVARAAGATKGEAVKHSATVISDEAGDHAGRAHLGGDQVAEQLAADAVNIASEAGTIKNDILAGVAQSGITSGGRKEMLKATLEAAQKAGISAQKAADIAAEVADKAAFEAAKQAGATDEEALLAAAKENGKVHKDLGLEWKKATIKAAGYWAGVVLAGKDSSDPIGLAKHVCGAAHRATKAINVSSPDSEMWPAETAGETAARVTAEKKGLVDTPLKQAKHTAQLAANGAAACAKELGAGPVKTAIAAATAAAKVIAKAGSEEGLTQKEVTEAARRVAVFSAMNAGVYPSNQTDEAAGAKAGVDTKDIVEAWAKKDVIAKKVQHAVDNAVSEAQAYLQGEGSLTVDTKEEGTFTCGNKAVIHDGGKCSDYTTDIRNCGSRLENVSGVLYHCYAYKEPVCKTSEKRCVPNSCSKTCQAVR